MTINEILNERIRNANAMKQSALKRNNAEQAKLWANVASELQKVIKLTDLDWEIKPNDK